MNTYHHVPSCTCNILPLNVKPQTTSMMVLSFSHHDFSPHLPSLYQLKHTQSLVVSDSEN